MSDTLIIADVALEISPLRVGEIPRVLAALRPVLGSIDLASFDLSSLFCEHAESLLGAIALASRQPRPWVDNLLPDEAVRLAVALIEVNADFFAQRLAPELERIAGLTNIGGTAGSASYATPG